MASRDRGRARARAPHGRLPRRQRGAALIAAIAIVILMSLHATLGHLRASTAAVPTQREALTREALSEAKAALVAFAADNRNRPGGLPCPDRDGDGEAELACDRPSDRIGLLPWQTLKTGDLRDGAGERLWYALSASFRNDPDVAINSLSAGELSMIRSSAGAVPTEDHDLAAIVLSPGRTLQGQHRVEARASARQAYLDADNAVATTRFRSFAPSDAGNDMLEPLASRELFAVVDRVVAARIRREIVPILVQRYVERWERFPYAVPFEDPLRSALLDDRDRRLVAGLLPIAADPAWVQWDPRSISVRQTGGAGRLGVVDCSRTIGSEIRCMIDHTGPIDLAVEGVAMRVGYALVEPPSPTEHDFGPPELTARTIHTSPLAPDGSARITGYAKAPATGNRLRLHLRAPAPIAELTDRSRPVAEQHAWFARNQWYRTLYLVVAADQAGSGNGRNCADTGTCLLVKTGGAALRAPAALVFMGRARGASGATPIERFLEGDNRAAGTRVLWTPASLEEGNDVVSPLCPLMYRGCGERA